MCVCVCVCVFLLLQLYLCCVVGSYIFTFNPTVATLPPTLPPKVITPNTTTSQCVI